MKKILKAYPLYPLALVLIASCSGCYTESKTIVEGGRPVEVQLKNMDSALKVAIPKIDGCDYCVIFSPHNSNTFTRIFHYVKCEACEKHAWPDGVAPMDSVDVRDIGTFQITPIDIDGCEYFTIGGRGSHPDDIVHKGHCKKCARKGL